MIELCWRTSSAVRHSPEMASKCLLVAAAVAVLPCVSACSSESPDQQSGILNIDCAPAWEVEGEVWSQVRKSEPVRPVTQGPALLAEAWDCETGEVRPDGDRLQLRPVSGVPRRWQVYATTERDFSSIVFLSEERAERPNQPEGLRRFLRDRLR